MPRTRTIVGIGEALLCEYPDRVEPGGLAVQIARHAISLGHTGVAISRIGQDRAGDDLSQRLTSMGMTLAHVQTDPDLPTGRLTVRSTAGRITQSLTPRAAFDNLQWDFDMIDVAQQTDAVVFGTLARRDGQSRSVIKQFLAECPGAVRVFDLSNRANDVLDRAEIRSGFEFADAAVVDHVAAKALSPGWNSPRLEDAAGDICRSLGLTFLIGIERSHAGESLSVHSASESWSASQAYPIAAHEAAVVGTLHGVIAGGDLSRSAELAMRVAQFIAAHPNERAPMDALAG